MPHGIGVGGICCPLNESTANLIDQRRIKLIKDGAIVINVGRGAVIDQAAFIEELRSNRIFAAMDVFDNEPLSGRPNEEIVALANLPNVVATPHMAYNTSQTALRLGVEILDNIVACINGSPINVVN